MASIAACNSSTQAPPAKSSKPMPEGVAKTLHATLRYAVGLGEAGKVANQETVSANIDKFLAAPSDLPNGFKSSNGLLGASKPFAVGLNLMTKKKKPCAVFFAPENASSREGTMVIAFRGDRKQHDTKFVKMDNGIVGLFTSLLFTTLPNHACNFHPWFSSIVYKFTSSLGIDSVDAFPVNELLRGSLANAISKNNVIIAVCAPSSVGLEGMFHKLAYEKSMTMTTAVEASAHERHWYDENEKEFADVRIDRFQNIAWAVAQSHAFMTNCSTQKPVERPTEKPIEKPAGKPTEKLDGKLDEKRIEKPVEKPVEKPIEKPAGKPTEKLDGEKRIEKPVEKAAKKAAKKQIEKPADKKAADLSEYGEMDGAAAAQFSNTGKRDQRSERSGQCKFVSETVEGKSNEEAAEERATRDFNEKMKRAADSDDDKSDAADDNEKPRKRKKIRSDSDDESELCDSDDSDDSDEDDSEEDDDSDEEDSDESSIAGSDDEQEEEKPKKKSRLVKASNIKVPDKRKLTQTTLKADGSVVTLSAQSGESVSAKAECMLDAVEACSGIPLARLGEINAITATLREGFSQHRTENLPIGLTDSLHIATFKLTMILVNILNSTTTSDQITTDAATTRRMAIGTTSALIKMIPCIQSVMTSMQSGVQAIEDLEKLTKKIADDFNNTASKMEE